MFKNAKSFNLNHQRLWLLPEKAVYWQKKKILMLADLHIGKSGHFRKNGIPVPGRINHSNLDLLDKLIEKTEPRHLIILGDLFHSSINEEWKQFQAWRKKYGKLQFSLVIGNHDILPTTNYHSSHITLFKRIHIDPFVLIHDLDEISPGDAKDSYILGGHIHPAVKLKGRGRQSVKLPCFYFGKKKGILPAFGQFTGTHLIRPSHGDQIFAITDSRVHAIGSQNRR